MKREKKYIAYSYEHGDKSLPCIKELASSVPDIEKEKILSYLNINCIAASSGLIADEICPHKIIGHGNIFSDGTYCWNDVFINYVDRYNIPVPSEFRNHILENYIPRMQRHMLLRKVDRVEIRNNPLLGYKYYVCINKNGVVAYQNNTDCTDKAYIVLPPDIDAEYFIDPIMTELFCYDSDSHGTQMIDGYYWEITFYSGTEIVDKKEGRSGEDKWRYCEFLSIVKFIERYIRKGLGSEYMTDMKEEFEFYRIL